VLYNKGDMKMKSLHNRVRVNTWVNQALHERMVKYSKEFGWSKTRIVEDALTTWLYDRDMENREKK